MRIGIFGGTFDPVHLAHLVLAEQCREQAQLDHVLFVVAARPPHKQEQPLAPFSRRVEMLELALAGYPVFQISQIEKERPGPSYTVDTLRQVRQLHPDASLFLLLGSDCLPDLPHWHEPEQIASLAQLLVVARPGWQLPVAVPDPFRYQVIEAPLLDISSSDLRVRIRERRSVRYLIPRAVECYIETHGLYE